MPASRGERLQIMLTDEELVALDDWRFNARMPSRAAAVRELLKRGLAAEGVMIAGRIRSRDFGLLDARRRSSRGLPPVQVSFSSAVSRQADLTAKARAVRSSCCGAPNAWASVAVATATVLAENQKLIYNSAMPFETLPFPASLRCTEFDPLRSLPVGWQTGRILDRRIVRNPLKPLVENPKRSNSTGSVNRGASGVSKKVQIEDQPGLDPSNNTYINRKITGSRCPCALEALSPAKL